MPFLSLLTFRMEPSLNTVWMGATFHREGRQDLGQTEFGVERSKGEQEVSLGQTSVTVECVGLSYCK